MILYHILDIEFLLDYFFFSIAHGFLIPIIHHLEALHVSCSTRTMPLNFLDESIRGIDVKSLYHVNIFGCGVVQFQPLAALHDLQNLAKESVHNFS